MIVIVGNYRAACNYARQQGLTMGGWVPAWAPEQARRTLAGRDPDSTVIEYVHGCEHVLTPEVRATIDRFIALRNPPKSS